MNPLWARRWCYDHIIWMWTSSLVMLMLKLYGALGRGRGKKRKTSGPVCTKYTQRCIMLDSPKDTESPNHYDLSSAIALGARH